MINIEVSRLIKADYAPQCGWSSCNEMKALRKNTEVPQSGRNSASRVPFDLDGNINSCWKVQPASQPRKFCIFQPYIRMSKFLKIKSLSLSIYTHPYTRVYAHICICIYTHTYTMYLRYISYGFCFSGEPLQIPPPLLFFFY